MSCGTELAITEWAPSYQRASIMQATLAILGTLFAVAAWLAGDNITLVIGAMLLGSVVPYTFLVVMPTNKRLQAKTIDKSSKETMQLLAKWNRLHWVRSILSFMALIIFLLN